MGFLDRFLGAQNESVATQWKTLNDKATLSQIIEQSKTKPVVIFKHSTRCGVSMMAKYQLEGNWNFKAEELDFYYLDILRHRDVSNEIAKQFGVTHHSPQIIMIKNGKAVFDTSHHMISNKAIKDSLTL